MLRKLIVAVPLLSLALLIGLIISVNIGNTDSPVVREEVKENEPGVSEMSNQNPANPKAHWFQPTEFGEPKDMVLAIHEEWHNLSIEEQYAKNVDSEGFHLIASVVIAVNSVSSNIDSAMVPKFDALQETARKLTNPVMELPEEERKSLIPRFESQLDSLYEAMMNRP